MGFSGDRYSGGKPIDKKHRVRSFCYKLGPWLHTFKEKGKRSPTAPFSQNTTGLWSFTYAFAASLSWCLFKALLVLNVTISTLWALMLIWFTDTGDPSSLKNCFF